MNDPQLAALIDEIPKLQQRQDGLDEQLADLSAVAVRLGMYDADDYLKRLIGVRSAHFAKFGRGCSVMGDK